MADDTIFVCAYCAPEALKEMVKKYSKMGVKFTHGICKACVSNNPEFSELLEDVKIDPEIDRFKKAGIIVVYRRVY